jgi:hypothetical protein
VNVNNNNPKLTIKIPIHPVEDTLSCKNNDDRIVTNIGEQPLEIGYT